MVKNDDSNDLDQHHLGALYEEMQDDIKKILEIVTAQQPNIKKIPRMAERIEEMENNMLTIKLATTGTNHDLRMIKIRTEKLEEITDQLKDHETRLTGLEHPA